MRWMRSAFCWLIEFVSGPVPVGWVQVCPLDKGEKRWDSVEVGGESILLSDSTADGSEQQRHEGGSGGMMN